MTDAVTNSNTGNVKIEIKKNSGLTQALLEHVKSLDIFKQGTNIDWSKTLDKLAEIQEARKSSHGASIFRGGTEHGDWHNNFVVDEGPIEFTESEMKELYGAMGLNIESASESKEEVREEEAVAEEEQIPQNDSNPPENDPLVLQPPKDSNPPMRHYSLSEQLEGKSPQPCYEYDHDGRLTRAFCRNSDGTLNEYYDYEYDHDGRETRAVCRNSDGTVNEYWDFEYDHEGNRTRTVKRNSDGTVVKVD